jgi:tRNA (cmo5U34)-methyltransferase
LSIGLRKSSVKQIKERFDNDVERFSSLDIGQTTTVDAVLAMNLITQAAALTTPHASHVLDVGCGAGNYTLKLLQRQPNLNVTLVDLSKPMLERAIKRIRAVSSGEITAKQGDIREIELGINQFDVVLAAAVLHHLRDEAEWEAVFRKIYSALRPGGSFWVFDLVEDSLPSVQELMWNRYGEYLVDFKDEAFRDLVYSYIIQEDTPRSLLFQVDLMCKAGFEDAVILHKNLCYAAFGAIKPSM